MSSTRTDHEPSPLIPKAQEVLSRRRIRLLSLIAVALVLGFEGVKAIHHSVFVGPGKEIDIWSTAFWGLDLAVAAVVTFVMVKVAFSFDRLEGILEQQGQRAGELSREFDHTRGHIAHLAKELSTTQTQIQDVAHAIGSKGEILRVLSSDEIRGALNKNTYLYKEFLGGFESLTGAWGKLIEEEAKNNDAIWGGENFGLRCWSTAIKTYLEEEAFDIENRTVATNLALYIKLIESLVRMSLETTKELGLEVELFASANLLPAEYYNWKDYRPGLMDQYLSGSRFDFMDEYRESIAFWLREPRLKLKRVVLVENLQLTDSNLSEQAHVELSDLSVHSYAELAFQSKSKILCDRTTSEPRAFSIEEIGSYLSVDPGFYNLHKKESAYAIAPAFTVPTSRIESDGLTSVDLFDLFTRELHSKPVDENALYLMVNDEVAVTHLDYLPTISVGKKSQRIVKCPDFLAIRICGEGVDRLISCIAARSKPNHETMSLRLITAKDELDRIKTFIDFASARALPINSLKAG